MEHFYKNIGGWFDFEDVYSEAVAAAQDDARFVEMGAFAGKSTAYMAVEIINSGKQIEFFAVDRWKENCQLESGMAVISLERFKTNMRSGGVMEYIQPLEMLSVEAAALFDDLSLDFVFIDGDHDYAAAKSDIAVWRPKVKIGGVLAGHDIEHDGVSRALRELFCHGENIKQRHKSWLWRKRP